MCAVRCLPTGTAGPCLDPLMLDANGLSHSPKVTRRVDGNLERSPFAAINGIVIHQTAAPTAQHTFNSYARTSPAPHGAHFLIAKDGTIYQTASLFRRTVHVGKIKSRCLAQGFCPPVDPKRPTPQQEAAYVRTLGPTKLHDYEKTKPFPQRYPMNADALGIELVGTTVGPDPAHPNELLFEPVTAAQNASLTWLVDVLSKQFGIGFQHVLRHPVVSWKTPSEARTATWRPVQ